MTAIMRGKFTSRIASRRQGKSPKEYIYTVVLNNGPIPMTTVTERTTLTRNINDEYVVALYDDPRFNVFEKRL